jgi:myo-inositol 2-dehydrogenase/D-chiro-inositol 1-dehydrogenase
MTFRLALVGAGRMGATHARALAHASSAVEIACVVDPSEAAAARIDAPRTTLDDLPEVDGALVAVPTRLHVEVVEQLAGLGLPVLCEKPCGLTTDETRRLALLPIRLQVAYWRRFVPALRKLRGRIGAGELGEIAIVRCAQWDESPPSRAFRDPASSGGIVVDMGVHELDQIRWLTGQEIERVTGAAAMVALEHVEGDPESVELAIGLSGGAVASVSLARRHVPGETCRVEVLGSDGAASIVFVAPPDGDETIAAALRAQAEDFAFGRGDGATGRDAIAALEAAERARRALAVTHR